MDCPFEVGETVIFNPEGKWIYSHPAHKNGQECRIEAIDPKSYNYPGSASEVWAIDFEVVLTGKKFKRYSSEYFGKVFEF